MENSLDVYGNTHVQNATTSSSVSTNDKTLKDVSEKLWLYLGTITLIVGTFGHIFTAFVVVFTRTGRNLASSVYMMMLAVSGTVALYTGLLRFVVLAYSGDKINMKNTSDLACKIHTMLSYLSLQYFAWIQATIAVDRLLAVKRPFWYTNKCNWRLGLCVVCVEFLACAALNTIIPVMVGITAKYGCTYVNDSLWEAWQYIDLMSFSLIPATILILCNSVIIRYFKKSEQHRFRGLDGAARRSQTKMLVAANVTFLLTTIPISAIYLVEWEGLNIHKIEVAYTLFSILQYVGVSSTFLIYCAFGSKFRLKISAIIQQIKSWQKQVIVQSTEEIAL